MPVNETISTSFANMPYHDQRINVSIHPGLIREIVATDRQELLADGEDRIVLASHLSEENPESYESEDGLTKTKSVVIKIDRDESAQFAIVHKLQLLVETMCSPLVPKPMWTGIINLHPGVAVFYSVTEFIADAVTLEDIWDTLTDEVQDGLVQVVAEAVGILSNVSFNPEHPNILTDLHNALVDTEYLEGNSSTLHQPSFRVPDSPIDEVPGSMEKRLRLGGPCLGYYDNAEDFLIGFNAYYNKLRTSTLMGDLEGGLHITSAFQDWQDLDLCHVHLSALDLDWLYDHACFQHHDLEPRNILVRYEIGEPPEADPRVQIAAIIDWDMAGFYPPGFEYVLKDGFLGANNLQYSWYRLFKDRVAEATKLHEAPLPQKKFMKAIALIIESKLRVVEHEFGSLFRHKYIAREQLMRGEEVWEGWIRKPNIGEVRKYGQKDNDRLETEVLRELGIE